MFSNKFLFIYCIYVCMFGKYNNKKKKKTLLLLYIKDENVC
jgi:hypothetical protein